VINNATVAGRASTPRASAHDWNMSKTGPTIRGPRMVPAAQAVPNAPKAKPGFPSPSALFVAVSMIGSIGIWAAAIENWKAPRSTIIPKTALLPENFQPTKPTPSNEATTTDHPRIM